MFLNQSFGGDLSINHWESILPMRHIDELEDRLVRWAEIAAQVVSDGGDKIALGVELEQIDNDEMAASEVPPETAERYRRLCPVKESSVGLFRYCSLKNE